MPLEMNPLQHRLLKCTGRVFKKLMILSFPSQGSERRRIVSKSTAVKCHAPSRRQLQWKAKPISLQSSVGSWAKLSKTTQSWQLADDAIKEESMSSHVAASRLLTSASESSENVVADIPPISSEACECSSRYTSQCNASGQTLLNNSVCKRSSSQKRVVSKG